MQTRAAPLFAAVAVVVLAWTISASDARPAGTARLFVVQAVPGVTYDVEVVGGPARDGAEVGAVLGPFELPAGEHEVRFDPVTGDTSTATVRLAAGTTSDLVLHLPAQAGGEPVADIYREPTTPIGPGKARVLLAHTATVPPADVQVDGITVFTNIANGEFASADVPAGPHTAALYPTGVTTDPILGPLDIVLPARTLTLVYAVGTPRNGSMTAISHQQPLPADGSTPPGRIETGTAGLARLTVDPFGPS